MSSDESSDPRVGTLLHERYEVLERIAQGAMGVVYRGVRVQLERPVAIKFLHPMFAAEPTFMERFEREAMTMSRLDHPNCVSVIDIGVDDGPYIVMDFVTGIDLTQLIDEGPVEPRRAIDITCQVLAGLAHAHEVGIIHRDIKPANVMLADVAGAGDHVRILDFGLAKFRDAEQTMSGIVVGTPSYMSPEQAAGKRLDPRSDLYSTGAMLFQLLAAEKPFPGRDTYELIRCHIEEPPPTLAEAAGGRRFSPQLEAVVARALSKSPDERAQSAEEMSRELRAVPEASGAPWTARPAPPPPPRIAAGRAAPGGDRRRSRRWLLAVGGLVAVVAVLGTATGRYLLRRTGDRAGHVVDSILGQADAGVAADPPVTSVADARAVAARGHVDAAIRGLHDLRRANPRDGAVLLALGDLYFQKGWGSEGLAAYRDALAVDPSARTNPALIDHTVASLASAQDADLAQAMLARQIGRRAEPALRRAAKTTGDDALRTRIGAILHQLDGK